MSQDKIEKFVLVTLGILCLSISAIVVTMAAVMAVEGSLPCYGCHGQKMETHDTP